MRGAGQPGEALCRGREGEEEPGNADQRREDYAGSRGDECILDLGRFLVDRCKRLAQIGGGRMLGMTFRRGNADDPRMTDELLRTMENQKITQVLADHRVLRCALSPRTLPPRYLGPVFVLGRLFGELDATSLPAAGKADEQPATEREAPAGPAELMGEPAPLETAPADPRTASPEARQAPQIPSA